MVTPGVGFAVLINAIVLLGGLALVAVVALRRRERAAADPVDDWYDEAATLVREVETTADRDGVVAGDAVRRRVIPLSARLQGHARTAPGDVDDDLVRDVYGLGTACYRVGMEHTPRDVVVHGRFIGEELDRLADEAAALGARLPASAQDSG